MCNEILPMAGERDNSGDASGEFRTGIRRLAWRRPRITGPEEFPLEASQEDRSMAEFRVRTITDQFFIYKRVEEGEQIWLTADEVPVGRKSVLTGGLVEGEKVCPRRGAEPPTTVSGSDVDLERLQLRRLITDVHNTAVNRLAAEVMTMCTVCKLAPSGTEPVTMTLKLLPQNETGHIGCREANTDCNEQFRKVSPYLKWEEEKRWMREGGCGKVLSLRYSMLK